MERLGYTKSAIDPDWTLKLRNFLAEFSDFFSHFSQGPPSNYRHDRCERLNYVIHVFLFILTRISLLSDSFACMPIMFVSG